MNPLIRSCALVLLLSITSFSQGLQLLTPQPGTVLDGGQSFSITWSASSAIERVSVSYCWDDSMKIWETIATGIANTGTYGWRVPYFKTVKGNVKIRIVADGINIADTVDGPISITAMTPDAFEPNDDSMHATALVPGDTIKNCVSTNYGGSQEPQWRFCPSNQMWCESWVDSLNQYVDQDWFSIDVPAGKILNIKTIPSLDSGRYNDQYKSPKLMLWNQAGTCIGTNDMMMQTALRADVRAGGRFYCSVNYFDSQKFLMPHERSWYLKYSITAYTEDAASFALLSPVPGATLTPGEKIMITWSAGAAINQISLSYCWDDSLKYWETVSSYLPNTGSCYWRVPFFKTAKPRVWIRIQAQGFDLADTIDSPLSISAAEADVKEPNDDSLHATALVPGDTIKGCVAMGYGGQQEPQSRFCPTNQMGCESWVDSMKNYVDADWFCVNVAEQKILTVQTLPGLDSMRFSDQYKSPKITLFDVSGNLLATNDVMMNAPVKVEVKTASKIYCAVNYNDPKKSLMPHERAWYYCYSITATSTNADAFALLTPQPGASLASGEIVPITWSAGTTVKNVTLSYCWDDSLKYWESLGYSTPNTGFGSWRVPSFKTAKSKVWMRIVADGISMADTTDGSFSIEAAEPDKYEPNDDSIHSTILTFGDTAKKCVAMGYGGQQEPQTRFCPSSMMWCEGWKDSLTNYIDPDWYKVTTSASKLIQVRAIPGLDSNKYNDTWKTPKVTIMNTSGEIVASNDVMMQNGFVRFNSGSGGTFYCIVNHNPADKVLMPHERGWYFDYSLVAKIVADLEVLDIGPDSYVAKNGSYEMAMSGDASNIDISITAKTPAPGTISLAKLPIDSEVVSLRGQGTGLALISIEASSAISSALQQASISIPYNQITAGDSESKIEARYFNDSTGEWETIPFAIDAQTNTVTVSTTHFSIYGLFITDIKTPAIQKKPVIATGVSLNRAQGNGSLVLNYSLTQPGAVRIVLYGLNGKKYANIINNRLHPSGVFTKTVSVSQAVRRQVLILEAELAGKKMTQLLTIVR